jgi:hypothetical protein
MPAVTVRLLGRDLDHGDVGLGIRADDARPVLLRVIVQFHFDFLAAIDDMVVSDDVAVLVDDESGAGSFALLRRLRPALQAGLVAEEAAEEVRGVVVFILGGGRAGAFGARGRGLGRRFHGDVYHARLQFLGQR